MERNGAALIVGQGRVGGAILEGVKARFEDVAYLGRGDLAAIAKHSGPIIVATRVAAIDEILAHTPVERRSDLVFVQNGPLLELAEGWQTPDATLAVLWVAVAKRGDTPVPGRASAFYGSHANAVAEAFEASGITAIALEDEGAFKRELALKVLWLSVVPVLAKFFDCTVGGVVDNHRGALLGLLSEIIPVAAGAYGLTLSLNETAQIIIDYTASIPHFPGGVKELETRNGWLIAHGKRLGLCQEKHLKLLGDLGVDISSL